VTIQARPAVDGKGERTKATQCFGNAKGGQGQG